MFRQTITTRNKKWDYFVDGF